MSAFGGSELGTSVKQITSEDAFLHGIGIWTSYRPSIPYCRGQSMRHRSETKIKPPKAAHALSRSLFWVPNSVRAALVPLPLYIALSQPSGERNKIRNEKNRKVEVG